MHIEETANIVVESLTDNHPITTRSHFTCGGFVMDGPYSAQIQIRGPQSLADAIDKAAAKRLTNRSQYIRQSVLARLEADGSQSLNPARGIARAGKRGKSAHERDKQHTQ